MTIDPPRLFDGEADELERVLLGSASADAGSGRAQRRCLAALGAALAVSGSAAAAASAASAVPTGAAAVGAVQGHVGLASTGVTTALVAKWLGVGIVAGVAFTGTASEIVSWTSPQGATPAPLAAPAPPLAPAPPTRAALAPQAGALPVASAPTPVADLPAAAPSSALGAELRWLERARAALQQRDPGAALAALDARDREHPRGALGPETALLRVEALLARGEHAAARRIAEPWLAGEAQGAHQARLRALLEQKP